MACVSAPKLIRAVGQTLSNLNDSIERDDRREFGLLLSWVIGKWSRIGRATGTILAVKFPCALSSDGFGIAYAGESAPCQPESARSRSAQLPDDRGPGRSGPRQTHPLAQRDHRH